MKRRILLVLSIAVFIFAVAPAVNAQDAPKKWTFMVFLNANNDLERFSIPNMRDMEKAGISKDVNIIVQISRIEKSARRYSVADRDPGAAEDDWGLTSKMIADLGKVDMGDYNVMVDFFKWGQQNYPAQKYAFVIWNHGSGWIKNRAGDTRGISYDDESGNHISTQQLHTALESIHGILGRPLDILGMDACLMQMVEVCFEVRENVSYIAASEETIPGTGWPYTLVCRPLIEDPGMSAADFAKLITDAYAKYYEISYAGTTMSVVDCAAVETLARELDALAAVLMDSGEAGKSATQAARNSVQSFYYREHIDLGDFLKLLNEYNKDAKVGEAITRTQMAYQKAVIKNAVTGHSCGAASGIAIYYPKFVFHDDYLKLKFAAYRWDDFLKYMTTF